MLTALNDIHKQFLQPAKGMINMRGFLKETEKLDTFDQGLAIQKTLQKTKNAYKKTMKDDMEMKENLRKTSRNDAAYPSKVKKLEIAHEELARMRIEIKILEDARDDGISRAIARIETESEQLMIKSVNKLEELQETEAFLKIKKPVPPPHILLSRDVPVLKDIGKKNYLPVGPDGWLPTDEAVQNRYMQNRIKLPAQVPVPVSPPSGLLSKTLKVGARGLRFLPLVGELWTRKENAVLASAHALTEACIHRDSNAADTALYVGTQYAYRGFGFLSFVPNLADTADVQSIQKTLNFLVRSGCFNEYRMFVDKNKGVLDDLGLLGNLSILSDAELKAEEKSYDNLQIRLNPLRAVVQ